MPEMFLWVIAAAIGVMVVGSLVAWLVAERDERRWRRKFKEQQQQSLIREHRYGSSKRGRL